MMSLTMLLGLVGVLALFLTLAIKILYKLQSSWLISFLQNFVGVLFIISGFVKAADPLGTAYKMKDYFAQFSYHFEPTWFSFLLGLFDFLAHSSLFVAVVVIVFEILVGAMLVLGHFRKFSTVSFFALVVFFTILTGFTYLSGYVPAGTTFFEFGKWGAFAESNMLVTDCGCFGDFLVLEPFVSFMKDVFLFVPALILLFFRERMHSLFGDMVATISTIAISALSVLFCLSNFYWNIPSMDFRPFREGTNIREQKMAEMKAAESQEILGFRIKNRASGQILEIGYDQYMANYTSYPKEEWEMLESMMSEPAIKRTKISDFLITDLSEKDITEDILNATGNTLVIVMKSLPIKSWSESTVVFRDTVYTVDSVKSGNEWTFGPVFDTILEETVVERNLHLVPKFQQKIENMKSIVNDIDDPSLAVYVLVGGLGGQDLTGFAEELGRPFRVCTADDLLLKTIIRSNPGYVLMHDGAVVAKWHHSKTSADNIVEKMK